jgi:23S rRNA pseudouridine955/2504/2580 synthase
MKQVCVVFENEDCLILNKPAGLAVQGGKGVRVCLDELLAAEYSPRPLLVHRLDKDTSGLILAAKNRAAAARFAALFAGEGPSRGGGKGALPSPPGFLKQYLAVCAGRPRPPSGLISRGLHIRGAEKTALTAYKTLKSGGTFSLLELELGTGRMHQIRRHLALEANPVLGDDKYGDFALNKRLRREMGLTRLLLHASRIVIPRAAIDVSAPLPDYFGPLLELMDAGQCASPIASEFFP